MASTVTFDGAPPPGTINMGIGQPSADLLPVELLAKASEAFFRDAQAIELNYGVIRGDERFLESLASFLTQGYGATVEPESLFLSSGNSQAIEFVSGVFASPGDTVFVEEPSYFLAFQIFKDRGLNIVGIPIDQDGLSIKHLKQALKIHQPRFLYTIPSFHNPGGCSMSEERRRELVELSKAHDFLIIADEVYQLLYYYEPPPPAFATMIDSGTVVSLGSFSKILAPALRLGWMQCAPNLQRKMLAAGFPNSSGSMNHYTSHIARLFIDLGYQAQHLEHVRSTLRARSEAMDSALTLHFKDLANWNKQEGGYFYWLEFDQSTDTSLLKSKAAKLETGFQDGTVFSSKGKLKNCLRLSFSHYHEDDISKGVARLRKLFEP